jgi:hypothetical protein
MLQLIVLLLVTIELVGEKKIFLFITLLVKLVSIEDGNFGLFLFYYIIIYL